MRQPVQDVEYSCAGTSPRRHLAHQAFRSLGALAPPRWPTTRALTPSGSLQTALRATRSRRGSPSGVANAGAGSCTRRGSSGVSPQRRQASTANVAGLWRPTEADCCRSSVLQWCVCAPRARVRPPVSSPSSLSSAAGAIRGALGHRRPPTSPFLPPCTHTLQIILVRPSPFTKSRPSTPRVPASRHDVAVLRDLHRSDGWGGSELYRPSRSRRSTRDVEM